MAGIEKGRVYARGQFQGFAVDAPCGRSIRGCSWRRVWCTAARPRDCRHAGLLAGLLACLFFLQMGRIQHDQPRQFARGGGGDDLAAKAALYQQRQASAVIEMGVGEQ